jgi:hypothetical protein
MLCWIWQSYKQFLRALLLRCVPIRKVELCAAFTIAQKYPWEQVDHALG